MSQTNSFEYSIEELSPVQKKAHVSFVPQHWQRELDAAYRKVAREAEIPGFRRGKAPKALLERYFRKQVEADVMGDLVQMALERIVQEKTLRLADRPTLLAAPHFVSQQPLQLTIQLEVYPEVTVQKYKGLSATKKIRNTTEAEIDESLENKRNRLADWKPIEDRQELQASDIVILDAKGTLGETPFSKSDFIVDLGLPARAEIPGLAEALLGQPVHMDKHVLSFTVPSSAKATPWAGKTATLTLTAKSAYQKHLPALDDEFAKDTGEAETLEQLRQNIRQQLQEQAQATARRHVQTQLLEALRKENPLPLPQGLVQRVIADYLQHRRMETLGHLVSNHSPEQLQTMTEDERTKATQEAVTALATRDITFELLLDPIAQAEELEITEADMEKRFAEWSQRENQSIAKVKAEWMREDPELQSLRRQLLHEKVLEQIEHYATIVEEGEAHASA